MATKIVKTLKFSNDTTNTEYQINAARTQKTLKVGQKTFNGSADVTLTANDVGLPEATETWYFNCGTATTIVGEGGN